VSLSVSRRRHERYVRALWHAVIERHTGLAVGEELAKW
jgi:hypothetical protein